MPGACLFRAAWLVKPEYSKWLRADPANPRGAVCHVCRKQINVSSMGEKAIIVHSQGQKHKQNVAASDAVAPITSYRAGTTSSSSHGSLSASTSANPQSSSKGTLDGHVQKSDILRAELVWAMKCIDSHYSMRSCSDIGSVFAAMFPECELARSFHSAESKTTYLCTHGLGPYFKQQLKGHVREQSDYVLLFDETLNKNLQEKQLDIYVRIWQNESVKTVFWSSKFLGHATAEDIVGVLSPVIAKLGHSHLLQISMDGPNVNKKVHRLLQEEVEKSTGNRKILQAGTCGLHTIHNAFRSGCEAAKWDLETFLSSIYHLFHDSPARREDFLNTVGAPALPLKFCKHRWLENVEPAERAILLLPSLVSYCSHVRDKSVTEPSCKSYRDVVEAQGDKLLKAKLQFFVTISDELQPLLKDFQTDRPMIPFLVPQIARLVKGFMERFLKPSITTKANSVLAISRVDFEDKSNQVETHKIDVGFAATRSLLVKDGPSDQAKHNFRIECRAFLMAMMKKILEKSPMSFILPRNLEWMDPRCLTKTFADEEEQGQWNTGLQNQLQKTLGILCDSRRILSDTTTANRIQQQFKELQKTVKTDPEFVRFDPFDKDSKGIDALFLQKIGTEKSFQDLWHMMKPLLLLSHGQATVERGFSENKKTTTDNLQKKGLIARRRILQAVRLAGGAAKVPVTKEMMTHASSARQKHRDYLEKQQKEEALNKRKREQEAAEAETQELRSKKARLQQDISEMEKSANKLSEDAEKFGRLTLIAESNAIRRRVQEKKAEMVKLQKTIEDRDKMASGPSTQ